MIDLTPDDIAAAKANNLAAVTKVLAELEPRICQRAARCGTNGSGARDAELIAELEQEGRIAAWQCIERFAGEDVAMFFAFVDKTLKGVMGDKRRAMTRLGVSEDTAYRFEQCLSACAGDPYEAEREACRTDGVLGKWKLSPDMAYAARVSWQGVEYLDAPVGGSGSENPATLADRLAAEGHLSVSADLADASDVASARRRAVKEAVHATLARLGRQQAHVLRATHGIDPVPPADSDREIAEALEIEEKRVTSIRWRGYARFRELYLAGAAAGAEVAA